MNSQKHAQEFTELPNEMLSLLKEFSEIIFGLCYSEHEKGWLKGLDQTLINICRCPNRKGDKDAWCVHNSSNLIEWMKRRAIDVLDEIRNYDKGKCMAWNLDFMIKLTNALEINSRFGILLDNTRWIGWSKDSKAIDGDYFEWMKKLQHKISNEKDYNLFESIIEFAWIVTPLWVIEQPHLYPTYKSLKMRFNTWQNEVLWGLQEEVKIYLNQLWKDS